MILTSESARTPHYDKEVPHLICLYAAESKSFAVGQRLAVRLGMRLVLPTDLYLSLSFNAKEYAYSPFGLVTSVHNLMSIELLTAVFGHVDKGEEACIWLWNRSGRYQRIESGALIAYAKVNPCQTPLITTYKATERRKTI